MIKTDIKPGSLVQRVPSERVSYWESGTIAYGYAPDHVFRVLAMSPDKNCIILECFPGVYATSLFNLMKEPEHVSIG